MHTSCQQAMGIIDMVWGIRYSISACALGLGLVLAFNATASPDTDKELLDILLKKGTITQEEYNALLKSNEDDVEV
ncbi:MAG: hypothetical protein P8Y28_15785, partial [Gammaproteobacteria bacterium]